MSEPLKYLFKVVYKDGSEYLQNAEDRSITEPELRSCFYDVKQDEVKTFSLTDGNDVYLVDLEDGHFEVNGKPFFMHEHQESDNVQNGGGLKNFRLVFWRRHTHSFNQKVKTGEILQTMHTIVYRMGWQCTVEDKNYQQIMQIT